MNRRAVHLVTFSLVWERYGNTTQIRFRSRDSVQNIFRDLIARHKTAFTSKTILFKVQILNFRKSAHFLVSSSVSSAIRILFLGSSTNNSNQKNCLFPFLRMD